MLVLVKRANTTNLNYKTIIGQKNKRLHATTYHCNLQHYLYQSSYLMFLLPVLLHLVCQEKLKEVDRWHVVLGCSISLINNSLSWWMCRNYSFSFKPSSICHSKIRIQLFMISPGMIFQPRFGLINNSGFMSWAVCTTRIPDISCLK